MKKYFFLVFLLTIGILPSYVEASAYRVHFRYDRNVERLAFDESNGSPVQFERNLDVDILEFINSESSGQFVIVFLFGTGEEIARKNFDFTSGDVFTLDVPYFSFAKSIEIYRSDSSLPMLSYDLSQFMTCNKNTICEYEKGENFDTCLPDCIGATVQFSDETKKLLKQNNDVLTDPKTGEVLLRGIAPVATGSIGASGGAGGGSVVTPIVGGIVLLLIIGGVIVVIRLRKRNKQYGL